jgi:hypothetical protein
VDYRDLKITQDQLLKTKQSLLSSCQDLIEGTTPSREDINPGISISDHIILGSAQSDISPKQAAPVKRPIRINPKRLKLHRRSVLEKP